MRGWLKASRTCVQSPTVCDVQNASMQSDYIIDYCIGAACRKWGGGIPLPPDRKFGNVDFGAYLGLLMPLEQFSRDTICYSGKLTLLSPKKEKYFLFARFRKVGPNIWQSREQLLHFSILAAPLTDKHHDDESSLSDDRLLAFTVPAILLTRHVGKRHCTD